ncbi:MAG TPA: ABC transporter ATP-binding protein [Streptosporangiaceae bacterium]|jgi:peptide/nickel transport system ATP-binding protein
MAPLLEIADLSTEIRLSGSVVRALDGVSLTVAAGQCLGLVGESGSGKTITALSVLRLLPPGAVITGGAISLGGTDLTALTPAELRRVRGGEVGMIFQDPAAALNPTMTIGAQVGEVLTIHRGLRGRAAAQAAAAALGLARIPDPEQAAARYPHELSGGMRQRAMIAMALAGEPRLLIADEPTTALDVTTQLEILQLLDDLRRRLEMAVILITHDLGVIGGHADQVAVMYGGKIVEAAPTAELFGNPRHPYTQALFDAVPDDPETAGPARRTLYSIPGRPPDLSTPAAGCRFAPRCRQARDHCATHGPVLDGEHPGHLYACFFPVARPARPGQAGLPWPTAQARPLAGLDSRAGAGGAPWADAPPPPGVAGQAAGAEPLLRVTGLDKGYPVTAGAVLPRRTGTVSAVAGVSFDVAAGQTFGLVGESGCGKTTLARLLVGLERADEGSVVFRGAERSGLSRRELRRGRPGIQIMFQDPFGSLDPRQRVETILREPLVIQKVGRKRSHWRTVARILGEVGLPADAAQRFAREFSGGQRQRLALARALILEPDLIVADEPVSALDVSVQAQILNLMRKLQRQYGLSYLLISHDLSVVRYMADVIGVMYLGKLVESGPAQAVCASPAHPYTRGLLDAAPVVTLSAGHGQAGAAARRGIGGEPPSAASPPSGCRFRTRCPAAQDICARSEPPLRRAVTGQLVACHFPLQPAAGSASGIAPGPAVAGIGAEAG